MKLNPLTLIDFYKADHRRQYPEGTTLVYSNFTPRSSRLANVVRDIYDDKVVVFGLQYFIQEFLIDLWNNGFFNQPKEKVVQAYKLILDNALGPNAVPVDNIEDLHDLGYLPLEIKAIPEGYAIPIKVPAFTVKNTHPNFAWLTNFIETVESTVNWKACTSATIAREYRKITDKWAKETGTHPDFIQWQCHDFSARGHGTVEDGIISGAAHLLFGTGTDSVASIPFLQDYYGADGSKELIGGSVYATEHSVMCMGKEESEFNTYNRILTELYPSGIVSIVSDTWDYWNVITQTIPALKETILARNGKMVVRPDSGDPVRIICGYTIGTSKNNFYDTGEVYKATNGLYYLDEDLDDNLNPYADAQSLSEAEVKGSIECLWETFGGTITETGHKLLDSHIGLIYGDSITLPRANEIWKRLAAKGFCAGNVVFGVGSFSYQYTTRDSFGFAAKATYGEVTLPDGTVDCREIFKKPKTDNGTKNSAKGLLRVDLVDGEFVLKDQCTKEEEQGGELVTVFKDGKLTKFYTLAEIRQRAMASI